MTPIYLGIDVGTTRLKAAAIATGGELVAGSSAAIAVSRGADGASEQDPVELVAALDEALAGLRHDLGTDWRRVRGLGIAAQGGSMAIADRETGETHTPMSLWNDGRFYRELQEVEKLRPPEYWEALSLRRQPGYGLGRLTWYKANRPELLDAARYIYTGVGELCFHRLTGQWRQDAGNALQIGCYNVPERRLSPEPLALLDLPLDLVSPMRPGHDTAPLSDTAAERLQLPRGTPVAGPYMDHEAGYLAVSRAGERPVQCSLGTAWVVNVVLPTDAQWQSPFQLVAPAPVGEGWQIIQALLTGNTSWDWALEQVLGGDNPLRAAEGIFAEALLPPPGLHFMPWLARPNPLQPDAFGGAGFLGIGPATQRADLLRAVAAAMVDECFRILGDSLEVLDADCLVLGGGASQGSAFQRSFAGLAAPRAVHVLRDPEFAGTHGCIYAFDPIAGQAPTRKIAAPAAATITDLRHRFETYKTLLDRLYGHVDIGGTLTIQDTGATP